MRACKESILVQDVGFSEVRLSAGTPRVLNFSPLVKGDTPFGTSIRLPLPEVAPSGVKTSSLGNQNSHLLAEIIALRPSLEPE
jgi:hypothetical protein